MRSFATSLALLGVLLGGCAAESACHATCMKTVRHDGFCSGMCSPVSKSLKRLVFDADEAFDEDKCFETCSGAGIKINGFCKGACEAARKIIDKLRPAGGDKVEQCAKARTKTETHCESKCIKTPILNACVEKCWTEDKVVEGACAPAWQSAACKALKKAVHEACHKDAACWKKRCEPLKAACGDGHHRPGDHRNHMTPPADGPAARCAAATAAAVTSCNRECWGKRGCEKACWERSYDRLRAACGSGKDEKQLRHHPRVHCEQRCLGRISHANYCRGFCTPKNVLRRHHLFARHGRFDGEACQSKCAATDSGEGYCKGACDAARRIVSHLRPHGGARVHRCMHAKHRAAKACEARCRASDAGAKAACLGKCWAGVERSVSAACGAHCECRGHEAEARPECGTDGKTYANACERRCAHVRAEHRGVCRAHGCACTREYRPECGTDGKAYGNACVRKCAGVALEHEGECGKVSYRCYHHGGATLPMYTAEGCAAAGADAVFAGALAQYAAEYGECLKRGGGSYTWDNRAACASAAGGGGGAGGGGAPLGCCFDVGFGAEMRESFSGHAPKREAECATAERMGGATRWDERSCAALRRAQAGGAVANRCAGAKKQAMATCAKDRSCWEKARPGLREACGEGGHHGPHEKECAVARREGYAKCKSDHACWAGLVPELRKRCGGEGSHRPRDMQCASAFHRAKAACQSEGACWAFWQKLVPALVEACGDRYHGTAYSDRCAAAERAAEAKCRGDSVCDAFWTKLMPGVMMACRAGHSGPHEKECAVAKKAAADKCQKDRACWSKAKGHLWKVCGAGHHAPHEKECAEARKSVAKTCEKDKACWTKAIPRLKRICGAAHHAPPPERLGVEASFYSMGVNCKEGVPAELPAAPSAKAIVPSIALAATAEYNPKVFGAFQTGNNWVAEFRSDLWIERPGEYALEVGVTDADSFSLSIDGDLVAELKCGWGLARKRVTRRLKHGRHRIELLFADDGWKDKLVLSYAGPDTGKAMQIVPQTRLLLPLRGGEKECAEAKQKVADKCKDDKACWSKAMDALKKVCGAGHHAPPTHEKGCVLRDGDSLEVVKHGWSGKGRGSNHCNTCRCTSGALACTKMSCKIFDAFRVQVRFPHIDFADCCGDTAKKSRFLEQCSTTNGVKCVSVVRGSAVVVFEGLASAVGRIETEAKSGSLPPIPKPDGGTYDTEGSEVTVAAAPAASSGSSNGSNGSNGSGDGLSAAHTGIVAGFVAFVVLVLVALGVLFRLRSSRLAEDEELPVAMVVVKEVVVDDAQQKEELGNSDEGTSGTMENPMSQREIPVGQPVAVGLAVEI